MTWCCSCHCKASCSDAKDPTILPTRICCDAKRDTHTSKVRLTGPSPRFLTWYYTGRVILGGATTSNIMSVVIAPPACNCIPSIIMRTLPSNKQEDVRQLTNRHEMFTLQRGHGISQGRGIATLYGRSHNGRRTKKRGGTSKSGSKHGRSSWCRRKKSEPEKSVCT